MESRYPAEIAWAHVKNAEEASRHFMRGMKRKNRKVKSKSNGRPAVATDEDERHDQTRKPRRRGTANGANHEAGSFRARYSRNGSAREAPVILDPVAVARALGGEVGLAVAYQPQGQGIALRIAP